MRLTELEAVEALKKVATEREQLTSLGYASRRNNIEASENRLVENGSSPYARQFLKCLSWLEAAHDPRSGKRLVLSDSYFLKHVVERWPGRPDLDCWYIRNGVFIAAAIHLGRESDARDRQRFSELAQSPNSLVWIPASLYNIISHRKNLNRGFRFETLWDRPPIPLNKMRYATRETQK